MEEDNDYLKLSIEDKCQHKAWKARVLGYEEATKLFQQLPDEKSPEFNKYLPLLKKFVVDSNVAAQEKGLAATLAFIENAACATKTCGEVMSGIVTKCLGSPKAKIKELAFEIILMYIEIEKHEVVQEELLKGLENKNPKIVSACTIAFREALKCFGLKVINLKQLLKLISKLLESRDKTVREETKQLTIEIYRWIKDALKPHLQSLKPVQINELEAEFAKVASEKPSPTRYLRSQQEAKQQAAMAASAGGDQDQDSAEDTEQPDIDPYELLEAVDILSKLPKDFYEKCEAKKWQERKEALEALQTLASNPKLESGDYGEVVRVLKKMISKDSNVLVVALAGKCLAALATGLRKKFQPYAGQCIPALLEKFKEKKQNVVQALREAIDAVYKATTLDSIQEDVQGALDNKNPQIKAETALFLSRCFTQCTPTILNKKLLKPLCVSLLKTLNESDPAVREASAEALGTAWKVVGERLITPFLPDVDALKMAKIKECSEKAVIVAPQPVPKKTMKKAAAPEAPPKSAPPAINHATFKKPMSKPAPKAASSAKGPKKSIIQSGGKKPPDPPKTFSIAERDLSEEEAQETLSQVFPPDVLSGLSNSNWKERMASVEKYMALCQKERENVQVQALVKMLVKKPGFKDNNFQILKLKMELLVTLVEPAPISQCTVDCCLGDLVDKLGDPKIGPTVAPALSAFAQSSSLEYIAQEVLQLSFNKRNPKIQAEALIWLAKAITEFGLVVQVKTLIDYLKKSFSSTNPAVKTSALTLLGTLYLYIGPTLRTFFEDEKPALLQQIDLELSKHQNETPPAPTRSSGGKPPTPVGGGPSQESASSPQTFSVADLIPRVDIGEQITAPILTEMTDKNWKVRGEALQKVSSILNDAKFIGPNLGDLLPALKGRLTDSNKNLIIQTLSLCQSLATALGPHCPKHLRNIEPGLLTALGDSKNLVRNTALETLNTWLQHCGLGAMFEGEMMAEALRTGNPTLRTELLGWLIEKLPEAKDLPNADLVPCIHPILQCLEDRNSDVRKKAQDILLPLMLHVGFEPVAKATTKLKPASKNQAMAQIEKLRPSLPAKPTQPAKPPKSAPARISSKAPSNDNLAEEDTPRSKIIRSSSKSKLALKARAAPPAKKEEEDTSPPLVVNNMKEQRLLDEKTLKVLKWNFTAPREEFYHQLKDQMMAANWSATLISQCFHNDFKFHIKAIDILTECLALNFDATISNLDLILKWLAIRFFDTNPSVLIRSLEYLQQLFGNLNTSSCRLHEIEASSFIPYLILKIGDPKDAVRKGVREILKLMHLVYPPSKIFFYVMQGLTSKNARQRAECLEELGSMIEECGMSVCQPSPAVAFKEIAKQIADRDNTVRNAALNCAVQAYFLEGEKVYKLVGQLTDKEMGLLEERIKRSRRQAPVKEPAPVAKSSPPSNNEVTQPQHHHHQPEVVHRNKPSTPASRPKSGPFSLELDDIENMFKNGTREKLPEPMEINIDEILKQPDIQLPPTRLRPPASAIKLLNSSAEATTALNVVMSQLTEQEISIVVEAFAQVEEVLQKDAQVLSDRVDQLLLMGALQYRLAHTKHMADDNICRADIIKLYRCVTITLVTLFQNNELARKASRDVLRDLIPHLVTVMLDTRLNELQEGPQVVRTINILMVKIIRSSNPTHVMSALIKLLHDSVGSMSATKRYTEIVMKCLWKMLRMIDTYIHELNFDRILLDIHTFLKMYPSSFWKERTTDIPLKTIKTIIFNLVKYKGDDIYKHLALIPNRQESDLEVYIQKLINMHKDGMANTSRDGSVDQSSGNPKKNKTTPKLTKATHDSLAVIFKKIGSKEQTKAGLEELYRFVQSNPEADIEPYLQKSSEFFQDYIRRGLKEIEEEKITKPPTEEHAVPQPKTDPITLADTTTAGPHHFPPLPPATSDTSTLDWVDWLKAVAAYMGQDSNKYDDPSFVNTLTACSRDCTIPFSQQEMQDFITSAEAVKELALKHELRDFLAMDSRNIECLNRFQVLEESPRHEEHGNVPSNEHTEVTDKLSAKETRPKETCHHGVTTRKLPPHSQEEVGRIKLTPKTTITTLTASQLSARRKENPPFLRKTPSNPSLGAPGSLGPRPRYVTKGLVPTLVFLEFLQKFSPVDYIDALENMLSKDCVHQLAKMSGQILVGLSRSEMAERLIEDGLEIRGALLKAFPYRKKPDKITLNGLPFVIEESDVIKALRPFCQVTSIAPVILTDGKRKWQDTRRDAFVLMHDGMKPTCGSLQSTYSTTSFTPAPPATEVSATCDPVAVVSDSTPATSAEHETSSEKEEIVENKTTLTDEESLPGAKTREQKQLAALWP
ncbi:msps [Cordylochernes scorpioides]|uniref:Msps n=1 Tax=Cordylochernes scorpioides TaxID=51811 RepID=A0ABY6JUT9_9ARAC|nr:msps [Cordylochernes scorpioides]